MRSPHDAPDYLRLADRELVSQCRVHKYRSRGPGGQKRNVTDSAVRLHHGPTGLIVTAVESRSQHENKARAVRRLREAIAMNVRRPIAVAVEDWSRLGAADALTRITRRHEHYCRLIQTVLDVLEASSAVLRDTASALGCSTGQLTRFLKTNPRLWVAANQTRNRHGRSSLR